MKPSVRYPSTILGRLRQVSPTETAVIAAATKLGCVKLPESFEKLVDYRKPLKS